MKKYFNLLTCTVLVIFLSNLVYAQKYKFGHINSDKLLRMMPERSDAQKTIQKYAQELEKQLSEMQQEYRTKYQDFIAKRDSMSDIVRQTKAEELANLEQRIQNFQLKAQQDLQNKEAELMKPIIDKAQKAISEVAKEQGFTYIFDLSAGTIVYFSENSEDILPLVKKKLGLTNKQGTENK